MTAGAGGAARSVVRQTARNAHDRHVDNWYIAVTEEAIQPCATSCKNVMNDATDSLRQPASHIASPHSTVCVKAPSARVMTLLNVLALSVAGFAFASIPLRNQRISSVVALPGIVLVAILAVWCSVRALQIALIVTPDGLDVRNFFHHRSIRWNDVEQIQEGGVWVTFAVGYTTATGLRIVTASGPIASRASVGLGKNPQLCDQIRDITLDHDVVWNVDADHLTD